VSLLVNDACTLFGGVQPSPFRNAHSTDPRLCRSRDRSRHALALPSVREYYTRDSNPPARHD